MCHDEIIAQVVHPVTTPTHTRVERPELHPPIIGVEFLGTFRRANDDQNVHIRYSRKADRDRYPMHTRPAHGTMKKGHPPPVAMLNTWRGLSQRKIEPGGDALGKDVYE